MKRHLILIGYRGTGKTTVGRLLAERLGVPFVDADAYLEAKYGQSIKEIFETEQEAGFRDKESIVLRELSERPASVIATGGGVILRDDNRQLLKESGFVVWLRADVPTVAERIQADPTTAARRPNLTVGGLAEIEQLLRVREPLYRGCADLEIDAAARSPESLTETILRAWASSNSSNSSG